jgi:hypothetical protein
MEFGALKTLLDFKRWGSSTIESSPNWSCGVRSSLNSFLITFGTLGPARGSLNFELTKPFYR